MAVSDGARMCAAIGPLSMVAIPRKYALSMMEMAALVLKINRSAGLGPGSAAAFAATVMKNHAMVLMDTRCPLVQRYAFP